MDKDDLELSYWGNCTNSYAEEEKQYVYAELMQIQRKYYSFITENMSILDIGGGPSSMLLKCWGLKRGLVVDPLNYPAWTVYRYRANNIEVLKMRGEDFDSDLYGQTFDECWIYNCLQHVDDPNKIISNALKAAPVLRIFEWIDIPPYPGHPQMLTAQGLREAIGSNGGEVQELGRQGCYGRSFSGVFHRA